MQTSFPSPLYHPCSPFPGDSAVNGRQTSLLRELPGIFGPLLVTVAVVAMALWILNLVPGYVAALLAPTPTPPPSLTERLDYPTIEAAEVDLQVKVVTPVYFPSYLVWPPASIRGQRDYAKVVSLLIRDTSGQQALQLREIFWPGDELPFAVPEPMEVLDRSQVDVNGVQGALLLGRGQGGNPVNQLRWHAGGIHAVLTTILPPEELLRIGRSMHLEEVSP